MRRWLIRTHKTKKILGPISEEKLKELIDKNSVQTHDEICPANGFWFYLHEQDIVKSIVFGDEVEDKFWEEDQAETAADNQTLVLSIDDIPEDSDE